jgi:hypothetical protein
VKVPRRWDLWYPNAADRGRLDPTDVLLVHAAPDVLDVDVRSDDGDLLAQGRGLKRTADRPMSRLSTRSGKIEREDCWPSDTDLSRPVILSAGEDGLLLSWWNAEDGSEWRWRVEVSNHR